MVDGVSGVPGWSLASSSPLTCPQVPLVMKALQRQLNPSGGPPEAQASASSHRAGRRPPGNLAEHMPVLVAGRVPWNLGVCSSGFS